MMFRHVHDSKSAEQLLIFSKDESNIWTFVMMFSHVHDGKSAKLDIPP